MGSSCLTTEVQPCSGFCIAADAGTWSADGKEVGKSDLASKPRAYPALNIKKKNGTSKQHQEMLYPHLL